MIIFENTLRILHFLPTEIFYSHRNVIYRTAPQNLGTSDIAWLIGGGHLHGAWQWSEGDQCIWRAGFVSIFDNFTPKFRKFVNENIRFRMPRCASDAQGLFVVPRCVCICQLHNFWLNRRIDLVNLALESPRPALIGWNILDFPSFEPSSLNIDWKQLYTIGDVPFRRRWLSVNSEAVCRLWDCCVWKILNVEAWSHFCLKDQIKSSTQIPNLPIIEMSSGKKNLDPHVMPN